MLLCALCSTIHISRKSWHTLLNTCFHIAMTTAIYAGGISLTSYPVVCQAVSPHSTPCPFFWLVEYKPVAWSNCKPCNRWVSPCITPLCQPCCGSESVPGSSTKKLFGEHHGKLKESLLLLLLSDLCSGQWAQHTSTHFCTGGLLLAVNLKYVTDRCGCSSAWPPRLCSIKVSHCAPPPKSLCYKGKLGGTLQSIAVRHKSAASQYGLRQKKGKNVWN